MLFLMVASWCHDSNMPLCTPPTNVSLKVHSGINRQGVELARSCGALANQTLCNGTKFSLCISDKHTVDCGSEKRTCFSALSSGMSSIRFRECTQNRLRPIEKGLHSGSATTRSPAKHCRVLTRKHEPQRTSASQLYVTDFYLLKIS